MADNVLQYVALLFLMLFFLFAGHSSGPAARRRARWEVVPLVCAVVLVTMSMATTPAALRHHTFTTGDMRVPGIAAFYFFGGFYYVYVLACTSVWAWQYASEADSRMRWGLRTASLGLGLSAAACTARALYVLVRFAGGTVPSPALHAAVATVAFGTFVFLIGVCYPALLMRIAAMRTWLQHRQTYYELQPLWEPLHHLFPKDALDHAPTRRDRLFPRSIHRRYWRRVIEIRDGLVRLSPHLADLGFDTAQAPSVQAHKLIQALRRQHGNMTPSSPFPVLVAAPPSEDPEQDAQPLLPLAAALSSLAVDGQSLVVSEGDQCE